MMRKAVLLALAPLCLAWAAPVSAQERLLESTIPEALAQVLREEGYGVETKKAESGDPYFIVTRDKWVFSIDFYSCDLVKGCESLQFYTSFKGNPGDTLARVNEWNAGKRFLKVAITKDGNLEATMDLSVLGKMTRTNFADVIDWWDVMTDELLKFFPDPVENKPEAVPEKKAP